MKRFITFMIAAVMILCISACSDEAEYDAYADEEKGILTLEYDDDIEKTDIEEESNYFENEKSADKNEPSEAVPERTLIPETESSVPEAVSSAVSETAPIKKEETPAAPVALQPAAPMTLEPTYDASESKVERTQPSQVQTPTAPSKSYPSCASVIVPEYEESVGNLVWVPTNGGKKYHKSSSCSNMIDPKHVTVETAEMNGYTPCKRCYK